MERKRRPRGRTRHIRLGRLLGPGHVFKIARTVVDTEGLWRDDVHDHDFAELFWIQEGRGLHVINGRRLEIAAGFACMMRPADRHNFRGCGDGPLAIMNLAFPRSTLAHFRRRYFPKGGEYFWTKARLPWSRQLDAATLRWLDAGARELAGQTGSVLALDRFFTELFMRLAPAAPAPGGSRPALPDWLAGALGAFRTPEQFRQGTSGLADLAGRAPEHVNRTLRRCLGVTATGAVNRARLEWAAQELRFTDRPIIEIGLDAGFSSLSHFYGLFRARFGCAPRGWRQAHRDRAAEVI